MFIVSGELSPLAWGMIWANIYLVFQLLVCFKAKRAVVKNVPAMILVVFIIFGIMTHMGVFGGGSAGAIAANQIMGIIIISISLMALMGVLAGWLIYYIVRGINKNRQK